MAGAERIMRGYGNADRAINPRQFFHNGDVFGVAEAGAAILTWNEDTQKTKLSEFFEDVDRKDLPLVPLHDVWPNFLLREFAHDSFYFEQFLTVAELHN